MQCNAIILQYYVLESNNYVLWILCDVIESNDYVLWILYNVMKSNNNARWLLYCVIQLNYHVTAYSVMVTPITVWWIYNYVLWIL